MPAYPPLAPFPSATWRNRLSAADWTALVEAWDAVCRVYLSLPAGSFEKAAQENASLVDFVLTFVHETAHTDSPVSGTASLLRPVFHLSSRLLKSTKPQVLLDWKFLAGLAKIYPKRHVSVLFADLFSSSSSESVIEGSLSSLKKLLIPHLESGIKGDLKLVESSLVTLNPLLHVSTHACILLLAGSDFFDGLVACFKVMNPPLRKAIIATTFLCIVGLTEAEPPKWSMLNDQLFTLQSVADAHKYGPLNVNDSLVGELVTTTPLLKILLRTAQNHEAASDSFRRRLTALEAFRKGPLVRPKRLIRRKVDKGKGVASPQDIQAEIHVHRMSQITQVQDLFPDLGAGFVSKCLDEYEEDVEQVVANLLAESLPPHLADADRSEPLTYVQDYTHKPDLAPRATPPPQALPVRRNVFDDDELDRLNADMTKISFGKKPQMDTDALLAGGSTASNKAAILSALAAFDSDDDERDDTYDATDVGGLVDTANQEADGVNDGNEEILFRAFQADEKLFERNADTRRGQPRLKLREETGMTNEAIEGWAVMLARNSQQRKRLEGKYAFAGQQAQIERTAWTGTEGADSTNGAARDGGGRGRGASRGRSRGGRGGGNVAGASGEADTEAARRRKEAHKGSRANHNRRDARAKKMARGGFSS